MPKALSRPLHRLSLIGVVLLASIALASGAEPRRGTNDPRVSLVFESPLLFNGVATSDDGRIFMPVQRTSPNAGLEVGEVIGGALRPYPDEAWNGWSAGHDPAAAFVGVNALRIGPDGALWVVDAGSTGVGKPQVAAAAKLVRIDLATNTATRTYPLGDVVGPTSFVDDLRFNGRRAYLTDAGAKAGLIVLDLDTGKARRVLDGDRSVVQGDRPLTGEGRHLIDAAGKPVVINADQLEVSPDGKTFYFQPCTGPLYSVPTRLLDDPATTPEDLSRAVKVFADTHSTGGSAIAADGTIFISDTDRSAVMTIAPDGMIATLVQDPKLAWVDAMWIDRHGILWMPAAQRDRVPDMNSGKSLLQPPLQVFTIPVGKQPVR